MRETKRTRPLAGRQQLDALPAVQPIVDTMLYSTSDLKRVRAAAAILTHGYGPPRGSAAHARKPEPPAPNEFRFYARLAIEVLRAISERSENARARIEAGVVILDRAFGVA